MKKNYLSKTAFAVSLFCCMTLVNTACVNKISDDPETELTEGTIPISFSVQIKQTATKVTGNAFEKGDKAGLIATTPSCSIKGKRYIDNLSLTYSEDNNLVPKKSVFYPEGDIPLNFISYYPYQNNGVPAGSSILPVSVQTDQSNSKSHSLSDFMVAQTNDVTNKEKDVALEFQHKFAKLTITMTPDESCTVQELLDANPRIIATGLQTTADYDLGNGTFSNLQEEKDIVAFGKWSINTKKKLTGKEFIIIPQSIGNSEQSFILEWNGRIYSCEMPKMEIGSNMECVIDISTTQTNSNALNCFAGSIKEWDSITNMETDNTEPYAAIHIPALSFSQSNIYRIYHDGMPVAEVCKEYLKSTSLTSRAIVAYPITPDEKTDLSNGIILQLIDCDDAICGGRISWNTDDHGFTYTEGESASIDKFYIDDLYHLSLSKPTQAINVNIINHVIQDIRGKSCEKYPITKIGKQYWMGKELRATAYRDGTALKKQTELGTDKAGYYKPDKYNIYFYNGEAVLAGELAPEGWRLPSDEEWKQLEEYIGYDAAVLKAGEWQVMIPGEVMPEVTPVNNHAWFNAYPVGMWLKGAHYSPYKMTAFWSWDALNNTLSETTFYLLGEQNKFVVQGAHVTNMPYYKALSIRCIKE